MVARAVEHDRGDVVRILPNASAIACTFSATGLARSMRPRATGRRPSCGRTSAAAAGSCRVADGDHRHRAVAAANDDRPLERIDREIDRLASAADDGVAGEAAPLVLAADHDLPSIGIRSRAAHAGRRGLGGTLDVAAPSQRPLASAARSVTAAYASHWHTLPSPVVLTVPESRGRSSRARPPVWRGPVLAVRGRCYPRSQMTLEAPVFQAYCGAETPRFANDAELECAKILDFYGVPGSTSRGRSCSRRTRTAASSRRSPRTSTCRSRTSTSS